MTKIGDVSGQANSAAAERRMRSWATGLSVRDRIDKEKSVTDVSELVHPFVTISRQTGAGGSSLGCRVAELLKWQLLDHELLHHIAETYHLPESMLEYVDEHSSGWVYEIFGKWLYDRAVTQTEYVTHLGQTLLTAVHHESTVIVGRGARFLLPRERGVAVRVVAPLNQRVERICELHGLDRPAAKKYVEKNDAERREFVERYFHHDVTDPNAYDLVINREFVDLETAAGFIVELCKQRFRGDVPVLPR